MNLATGETANMSLRPAQGLTLEDRFRVSADLREALIWNMQRGRNLPAEALPFMRQWYGLQFLYQQNRLVSPHDQIARLIFAPVQFNGNSAIGMIGTIPTTDEEVLPSLAAHNTSGKISRVTLWIGYQGLRSWEMQTGALTAFVGERRAVGVMPAGETMPVADTLWSAVLPDDWAKREAFKAAGFQDLGERPGTVFRVDGPRHLYVLPDLAVPTSVDRLPAIPNLKTA